MSASTSFGSGLAVILHRVLINRNLKPVWCNSICASSTPCADQCVMAAIDINTWYVLQNAVLGPNNTLSASSNAQVSFDPNNPVAIYYAPAAGVVPDNQLWQLYLVNSTTSVAYAMRNRLDGPSAYLTTATTTRKCGGGSCATVPIMANGFDAESLWEFASWGFSDAVGGAYMYNIGNGSVWRMDVMDGGVDDIPGVTPELVPFDETGRLAQHWTVKAYSTFAASDRSSFSTIPTSATVLLAQYANATSIVAPYTAGSITATGSSRASTSIGSATMSGTSAQSTISAHAGLSTGGAIGIGVGIGVGVLAIVALVIGLFCYRKTNRRLGTTRNPAEADAGYAPALITTHNRQQDANINTPSTQLIELESPIATKKSVLNSPEPQRSEMSEFSQSSRVELDNPANHYGPYTHKSTPSSQWDETNSTVYGSGSKTSRTE